MRRWLGFALVVGLVGGFAWWLSNGFGPHAPGPLGTDRAAEDDERDPVRLAPGAPGFDDADAVITTGPCDPVAVALEWVGQQTGASVLTFTVVDAVDGTPLEGAVVRTAPLPLGPFGDGAPTEARAYRTDARGIASVRVVPGTAIHSVRKVGYVTAFQWAAIQAPGTVFDGSEPIHLAPAHALHGQVVEVGSRAPLADVRIRSRWAADWYGPTDLDQVTDAEGRFTIAGVRADLTVQLSAIRDGYQTVHEFLDRGAAGRRPVEIVLGGGAAITGRVLDAEGAVVPGAEVYVALLSDPSPFSPAEDGPATYVPSRAVADDRGAFHMQGLRAPSQVVVYARGPDGARGLSETVTLVPGTAPPHVSVSIQSVGSIRVGFLDAATGERVLVDEATVTLDGPRWATHAVEGAWEAVPEDRPIQYVCFPDVAPGRHRIYVAPKEYLPAPQTPVEITAGRESRVDIPLERGVTAHGRLLDAAGRPVRARISVFVTYRGQLLERAAHSEADGSFALPAVPASAGTLWITEGIDVHSVWLPVTLAPEMGAVRLPAQGAVRGVLPPEILSQPVQYGWRGADESAASGWLDPDEGGVFALNGLPTGASLTVYLHTEGRTALVLRGLDLEPGKTTNLGRLAFPLPHRVEGLVLDPAGEPAAGRLVSVVDPWIHAEARTDAGGRFRLDRLPPGRHWIRIEVGPSVFAFRRVDVAADMKPLEVRLGATGTLHARMLRGDGTPLAFAPLVLHRCLDDGTRAPGCYLLPYADAEGTFELHLPPGRYEARSHWLTGVESAGKDPHFVIRSGETTTIDRRAR